MAYSDDRSPIEKAVTEETPPETPRTAELPQESVATTRSLPYLPGRSMTDADVGRLLRDGTDQEKVELIGQLLSYAPWDEIWCFTDRDTVRSVFEQIELSPSLRSAWARNLGLDATE